MSEAKYKVGQVMSLPHHSHPLPIAEVVTCYRFVKEIGALWREEELTPYVKPLGVGDRVRWKISHDCCGALRYMNPKWSCIEEDNGALSIFPTNDIERIPTEAGK
jgi:hypothetical protein